MDFKVIDEMGPYRLVINDEDLVGLIDAEGNVCVPCEMDDVFESGDDDYCLMGFIKDGKYGLLLPDGKYVEPVYDDFMTAIIEGEFSVHVCEGDVYGFYAEPEYEYRIVGGREKSLLAYKDDDLSDDAEDNEDLGIKDIDVEDFFNDLKDLEEQNVRGNEYHAAGYDFAESVWEENYADLDVPDMKEYADSVISHIKAEDSSDWFYAMTKIGGAVRFMSDKCLANVDLPALNKKLQKYINENNSDGFWGMLYALMRILGYPDYGEMRGEPLSIPPDMRLYLATAFTTGMIGRLYVAETGMHSYSLCADLYDEGNPDRLVEDNCILGEDSCLILSNLIQLVQQLKDPDKKNEELSLMLEKALAIEQEEYYGHILSEHGMCAFFPEHSHSYDYVYVYNGRLYVATRYDRTAPFTPMSAWVKTPRPTDADFAHFLEVLKADINIAAARLKKQQES